MLRAFSGTLFVMNMKLYQHLVSTGNFVVLQFADDIRDVYAKILLMKLQRKTIVDDFRRGRQYEQLEGHLFLDFSAYNEK